MIRASLGRLLFHSIRLNIVRLYELKQIFNLFGTECHIVITSEDKATLEYFMFQKESDHTTLHTFNQLHQEEYLGRFFTIRVPIVF